MRSTLATCPHLSRLVSKRAVGTGRGEDHPLEDAGGGLQQADVCCGPTCGSGEPSLLSFDPNTCIYAGIAVGKNEVYRRGIQYLMKRHGTAFDGSSQVPGACNPGIPPAVMLVLRELSKLAVAQYHDALRVLTNNIKCL